MILSIRKSTALLAMLGIVALISACAQPHNAKTTLTSASATLPKDGSPRLLELINQGRKRKGLTPLILDARLNQAAMDHSSAMAQNHQFDHKVRGERGFQKRLIHRGYPRSHSAENIAMTPDPNQVYQLWFNSPGHYKNMFNETYFYVGIGRSGNYWTADFAAPDGM